MKWTDQSPATALASAPLSFEQAAPIRNLCQSHINTAPARVQIAQTVHSAVLRHCQSSRKELGGLLLGLAWGHKGAPEQAALISVIDAVAAPDSSGTGYSLRMEANVWSAANERLAQLQLHQPACRILGWYHSHPGLGAFFSATDQATQAAFFTHSYSTGWVIDPADDSHACFVGADSTPVASCYLVDDSVFAPV